MIRIVGPKALSLPTAMGGNDALYGLVVVSATRGIIVQDLGNGTVELAGYTDQTLLTVALVKTLLSAGAEVHGYPAFFVIDPDEECPLSTTDPKQTWSEWSQGPNKLQQRGDSWYRETTADGRDYMPASQWGDIPVISHYEYSQLPVESEPE